MPHSNQTTSGQGARVVATAQCRITKSAACYFWNAQDPGHLRRVLSRTPEAVRAAIVRRKHPEVRC